MRVLTVLVVLVAVAAYAEAFLAQRVQRPYLYEAPASASEQPLILTEWLNDPTKARQLSLVSGIWPHPSYSAFFTVNATTGSNMYWWFFPAQNGDASAPLLVYLEGGPGVSSLLSLFYQMGPFSVSLNATSLIPNPYTWNKEYAMIFIDNPVGTGFSFTKSPAGFTTNEQHVATDLYSLMEQFYTVFPAYKPNDLYVIDTYLSFSSIKTSESYGGHYAPALAHEIHVRNRKTPKHHMNLKGLVLGDPSLDPKIQMTGLGHLLFDLGLADENEVAKFDAYDAKVIEAIDAKDFVKAFHIFDEEFGGDFFKYGSLYLNTTSLPDYYNYMTPTYPIIPFPLWLNEPSTRQALHLGSVPYWVYNSTVQDYMIPDFMTSIDPFLIPVMEHYRVMIYSGQLDIILGPALTEKYLHQLQWSGLHEYRKAPKQHWYLNNDKVNNYVSGYVRQAKTLTQVVIRRAGHVTITDAPAECLDMLNRFINNKPWALPNH